MIAPSQEYLRISVRRPPKLHAGLDAVTHRIIGLRQRREERLHEMAQTAEAIERISPELRTLSEHRLREIIDDCRISLRLQRDDEPEAVIRCLAAVREASGRQVGLHPYKVQVIGALEKYGQYFADPGFKPIEH